MASQNKQKKSENANLWQGVKLKGKVKGLIFYNGSQRKKSKKVEIQP